MNPSPTTMKTGSKQDAWCLPGVIVAASLLQGRWCEAQLGGIEDGWAQPNSRLATAYFSRKLDDPGDNHVDVPAKLSCAGHALPVHAVKSCKVPSLKSLK